MSKPHDNDQDNPIAEALRHALVPTEPTSAAIKRVRDQIRAAETSQCTVLVTGETGTGKEVAARMIHETRMKRRKDRNDKRGPFHPVNCAAIPRELFESVLFGHVKGAFTSAADTRHGAFVTAENGTLFLDEIGELPLDLQAKLLRVLEDEYVTPVGSDAPIGFDVRIIAATNQNLLQHIAEGRFRRDLYYRLNVLPVQMLPLRERPDDIPAIAEALMRRALLNGFEEDQRNVVLGEKAKERLSEYHWPGNARELDNAIQQALCALPPPKRDKERVLDSFEHVGEILVDTTPLTDEGRSLLRRFCDKPTYASTAERFAATVVGCVLESPSLLQAHEGTRGVLFGGHPTARGVLVAAIRELQRQPVDLDALFVELMRERDALAHVLLDRYVDTGGALFKHAYGVKNRRLVVKKARVAIKSAVKNFLEWLEQEAAAQAGAIEFHNGPHDHDFQRSHQEQLAKAVRLADFHAGKGVAVNDVLSRGNDGWVHPLDEVLSDIERDQDPTKYGGIVARLLINLDAPGATEGLNKKVEEIRAQYGERLRKAKLHLWIRRLPPGIVPPIHGNAVGYADASPATLYGGKDSMTGVTYTHLFFGATVPPITPDSADEDISLGCASRRLASGLYQSQRVIGLDPQVPDARWWVGVFRLWFRYAWAQSSGGWDVPSRQ